MRRIPDITALTLGWLLVAASAATAADPAFETDLGPRIERALAEKNPHNVERVLKELESSFTTAKKNEAKDLVHDLTFALRDVRRQRSRNGGFSVEQTAVFETFGRLGKKASKPLVELSKTKEVHKNPGWRSWIVQCVGACKQTDDIPFLLKHLDLMEPEPVVGALWGLSFYEEAAPKYKIKIVGRILEWAGDIGKRTAGSVNRKGWTTNPRQSKSQKPYVALRNATNLPRYFTLEKLTKRRSIEVWQFYEENKKNPKAWK